MQRFVLSIAPPNVRRKQKLLVFGLVQNIFLLIVVMIKF